MSDKAFFDTTILIYTISTYEERARKAEALLAKGGWISVQVLNEFVAVSRRELKLSWEEIEEALGAMGALCEPVLPLELATHQRALKIAAQTGFRMYDALIVAAALRAGCNVLYSEGMQDGRMVEGLVIRNPFHVRP